MATFTKRILITVLLVVMCVSTVTASGKNEINSEVITSFEKKVEEYNEQHDRLYSKLELAYQKNDYDAYYEAKKDLKALEKPVLSKDEVENIIASMEEDDYETANWLYTHTNYYRPSIRLVSENEGFSYKQSISMNPGSTVKLPTIKGPNAILVFDGWGTEDEEVLYEPGSEIIMPVSNLELYAVFSVNPDFVEGKNCLIEVKNQTINQNEITNVTVTVTNNGTESLKNAKIKFTSDNPLLVILNEEICFSYLSSGRSISFSFPVISKASSGTELEGILNITDSGNYSKSETFIAKVN